MVEKDKRREERYMVFQNEGAKKSKAFVSCMNWIYDSSATYILA